MKEDFISIQKALKEVYGRIKHQPVRIKLNPEWARINIEKYPIRDSLDLKDYKTIYGIPVEFDETIETYEFIYE